MNFEDAFVAALREPVDTAEWDAWYAEHGRGAGVYFMDGAFIPGVVESIRFGIYKDDGLEAMREFDREFFK